MLLYYFLKVYFKIIYRLYFRKLYTVNAALVPPKKPMLLASNHPNSLVDSVIHTIYFPRVLHVITRGDVFKKRYLWFFKYTKQIPVFRFRDGYANMQKNKESFALCNQKLGAGAAITIFSEGSCIHQKKLRRVQKGTAKMALWALEANQYEPDIMIVPSGVNYTYANKYRSRAMVVYGEPIVVKDYQALYQEHPNKAFRQLTQVIQERLSKLVIHIDKSEDEPLFDFLAGILRYERKESIFPIWGTSDIPRKEEKALADSINAMSEDEKENLRNHQSNIEKITQQNNSEKTLKALYQSPNWLLLIIGFPLALIGAMNFPFPYIAKKITDAKVKDQKFFATVFIAVTMLLSLLVYSLALILILFFCGWSVCLLYWLCAGFAGFFAVFYRDALIELREWIKIRSLNKERKNKVKTNFEKIRILIRTQLNNT